jgi:hypothetical protein
VIEFLPVGGEARFDGAQAVAPGQLGERHRDELIPAGEGANPIVPLVSLDEFAKRVSGQMGQELGEDRGTRVHGNSPPRKDLGGMVPESDREKLKSMTANIMLLFFDINMFRNRPRC